MSRRHQLALYVVLSFIDFAATIFLVNNGHADEANPLIRGFVSFFPSFSIGLAVYKVLFLGMVLVTLRAVQHRSSRAAGRLLVFANVTMLALGAWHAFCLSASMAS